MALLCWCGYLSAYPYPCCCNTCPQFANPDNPLAHLRTTGKCLECLG